MKFKFQRALQLLGVLCLLVGISLAEDYYGAYPGSPTSATGLSNSVTVEKSVTSVQTQTAQSGKAVVALGSIGRASSTSTNSTVSTVTATYTTQAPSATQQNTLLSYNVQTSSQSAIYYSGTYLPWNIFNQTYPANTPGLWVASNAGWSWYARCPAGGWVQNLMYVPFTGTMKLYEFYPDGSVKLYSYGFTSPGYKYIWFYADTVGRHVALFTVYDKPSNYITIDVT